MFIDRHLCLNLYPSVIKFKQYFCCLCLHSSVVFIDSCACRSLNYEWVLCVHGHLVMTVGLCVHGHLIMTVGFVCAWSINYDCGFCVCIVT